MNLEAERMPLLKARANRAPLEVFSVREKANTKLAASTLVKQALKRGDRMPDFELLEATGMTVKSREVRKIGLLLVSFYHGEWCPYGNLELYALQEPHSELVAVGATLVAISPQTPDFSWTTR